MYTLELPVILLLQRLTFSLDDHPLVIGAGFVRDESIKTTTTKIEQNNVAAHSLCGYPAAFRRDRVNDDCGHRSMVGWSVQVQQVRQPAAAAAFWGQCLSRQPKHSMYVM